VVRDLPDLLRVSLLLSQRLLCLAPSPMHLAASHRIIIPDPAAGSGPMTAADLAVEVSAALFKGRHTAQLAALQRLVPVGEASRDLRLLFFKVGWGVG